MTILIEETLKRLESTPGMVEAIQAFGFDDYCLRDTRRSG